MYVTLEETKEYLGVYFAEKDEEIALLIEAAEETVANFLGCALSEKTRTPCDSAPDLDRELKPNVKLSILQHVAGWYDNKATQQEAALTPNESALQMIHFERVGLGV